MSQLEGFAIFVSNKLYGGLKSSLASLDLEFERENKYYSAVWKTGRLRVRDGVEI